MTSPGHVLLGGGTGFIGSAVRQLLHMKGYEVTVISRMPGPKRVTWLDITGSGLPEGITAVVNLAGQNVLDPMQRWTPGFKQNVWNSRVNTTLTLADAIKKAPHPPKVFATISGVGIYKPSQDAEYDEYFQIGESFDFLSKLAIAWEAAASLPPELGVRQAVIRSGVVLGRHGGMMNQLYLPFFLGLGGPIGSGTQYMPWIHIRDLAELFLFTISDPKVSGVINGVAPQVITNEEFTKVFAEVLGRPAFFRVPEFALNLMFSKERAKIMTEGQRVIPTRAKELGFTFHFPQICDALKDCARFFYSKEKPLVL